MGGNMVNDETNAKDANKWKDAKQLEETEVEASVGGGATAS